MVVKTRASTLVGSLKKRKCKKCGKLYKLQKYTPCQKYCGSYKKKVGCAYIVHREQIREYEKKHRDEIRQYKKEYYDEFRDSDKYDIHLEKVRAKRLKFRFSILMRDKFTCQYCGRKAPNVELQIDHIFPKSKVSKNTWDKNELITACVDCNKGKCDLILMSRNGKWKRRKM